VYVDWADREGTANARLATIHPKAYEAKMKAMHEYDPFRDIVTFIKNLFAKKAK